jgi:hypothetical protein
VDDRVLNKALPILAKQIEKARDLTSFVPDTAQRQLKSRIWTYYVSADLPPPPELDLATAARLGGDKRISQWWDAPGFQDWLSNKDEFKQRVDYIAQISLDKIEQLLLDPEMSGTAKVALIKMVMDLAGKASKAAPEDKYRDDDLNKMSKEDLEKFLADRLPAPSKPLTSEPE